MIRKISLPENDDDRRGDRRAEFEDVALTHLDSLYRTALWMTRSPDAAEDLVQETCLRAFRSFNTFARNTNCRAWLMTIMNNTNINRYRKLANSPVKVRFHDVEPFVAAGGPASGPSAGEGAADLGESLAEEVKRAVEKLPDCFRKPVLLSAVENLSYKEIARVLDCPIGTVMSRISRGRKLLKKALAGYAREQGYSMAPA